MKSMTRVSRRLAALCIAGGMLASAGAEAHGRQGGWQDPEIHGWALWSFGDRIEGLWDVEVQIMPVCGGPVAVTFDAMALFARGGTFHDTNGGQPSASRSSGFGIWKRNSGREYEFAFKLFRFNPDGTPRGSQVVRHTVTLARDGKSWSSEGTAVYYDVNGNQTDVNGNPTTEPGCSAATATRFE